MYATKYMTASSIRLRTEMRQNTPSGTTCRAAGRRLPDCCRAPLYSNYRIVAPLATIEGHYAPGGRPSYVSTSTGDGAACFSGRSPLVENRGSSKHINFRANHVVQATSRIPATPCSYSTREYQQDIQDSFCVIWRATWATAISSCMLLGSLAPGPDPLSLLSLQPPAAMALNVTDDSKMQQLRQLAKPDFKAMREISEELVDRSAPAGQASSTAGAGTAAFESNRVQDVDSKKRLKAPELASLLHIPQAEAKSLMAMERDLGRTTHRSATASLAALRGLLAGPPAAGEGGRSAVAVGQLVAAAPRLLLMPPAELGERFGELQSLLSAPPAVVRRLLSRQPGLLLTPPAELSARLSGLCSVFNVDPALATALAVHEPGLLGVGAKELAARAAAATGELQLERAQMVAVLRRYPGALLSPGPELAGRLRKVGSLLGLPRKGPGGIGSVVAAAPGVVMLGEQQASAALEDLGAVLQVPRERAVSLAVEQPSLLLVSRGVMVERLKTLAELAGVPMGQVRSLVVEKPSLLTRSSAAMRRAVEVAEAQEAQEGGKAAKPPSGRR